MSTRANILIKDKYDKQMFYRHSDGYPTGQKSLLTFMQLVKEGKLRDNVEQSSGWLIILGHEENHYPKSYNDGWKVGAYEPCSDIHGDIEFYYELDLEKMEIRVYRPNKLIGTIKKFDNTQILEGLGDD